MFSIQRVATVSGVIFILVGLLGFTALGMGGMHMGAASVMLLGLFPVNMLHNLVHMLFGVWGVIAGRSARASVTYALGSGAAYLFLGVLGLFTDTLLGIVPIGGYDVVLHLVLAVVLAGFGFWTMWFAPQQQQAVRTA
ncbi:MAG: DUF4383 domain-containing protein [Gemmatimonadales bacterium]|jgi:hypothetical protein